MNYQIYNNLVAKTIRRVRKEKNWTQATLAKKLKVDQATISNYESAKTECTVSALVQLKAIFGKDFDCIEFPLKD
ncbi:helix-turn-helix transcriptional regulator [Pseudoalteromonas luteoviolacea]|uniref:helix-turn-helix transcriptional regulator n=1 Tax=Pseudoalteromonas luteoviolacea TaxID=43657 RepID=UPI001B35E7ED|nr:helix-turn-helix transcriptional regulator [Pseudoalteromonas luteoviolacea]MBQ4839817.1 helix-turn-helix transcriptional regulator [Pseudoalteromonas luteoviolacea]